MSIREMTYNSDYGYERRLAKVKQQAEESLAKAEVKRLRAALERISKSPDDNPDHLRWLAKDALGEGK